MPADLPYCGAPPLPAEIWLRWNPDPLAWAAMAALAAAFLVHRRRSPGGGVWVFWLGWAMLALAFLSPLCALSSALFSARAVHHLLLVVGAAPLLALCLRRLPAPGILVTLGLHTVVLWAWHAPAAYGAALSNDLVYWAMQLSLLVTAVLAWRSVFAESAPLAAAGGLALGMVQMGLLGALITFAPTPLYAPHFFTTAPWDLTPLQDQQLAGAIMWAIGGAPYLAGCLWMAARLFREPEPAGA